MLSVYPPHPAADAAPHATSVWLDLVKPTPAEVSMVEDFTGVRLPSREELSEIEQSSRLGFEDGEFRLSAPVIANADTDNAVIAPIGLILTEKLLITIRYDALKAIDVLRAKADHAAAPASSVALFVALMEAVVERQADLLEAASAKLDGISHRVFRPSSTDPKSAARASSRLRERLQMLGRVGERTSMIRESLLATERMIPFVLENGGSWMSPEQVKRLHGVRDDIGSLSLFEEHLLSKVQFLLDAVLGFINIEQNDIFKVLTIASVVGIFPTLVAGWYGMNFQNMPEYHWVWGYQYGIGVIVASTVLPLIWFKWRGWM
jgi:magnesium transporter